MSKPPHPNHVPGTVKGEELAIRHKEPGREDASTGYRGPRDSTGINPEKRAPIDPRMPNMPPA
jgi:hypothetical protein